MTFAVGNPDFVQHRVVGDFFQAPVDLLLADSRRLPQSYQMRCNGGFNNHMLANCFIDIASHLRAEGGAAGQKPRDN